VDHTQAVSVSFKPTQVQLVSPGISPFTMAGFSPLSGVLRDACRPFDYSDPLPKSLHGLFCLFFYVWRECGPVPAGWSVWHISDCYHRSLVLYFSEFHTSQLLECLSTDRAVLQKYSAVCIRPGSFRRWRIGGPTEVYFLNQLGWDLVQASGESWDDDGKVFS
jgi:hypothetical protein